MGKHKTEPRVCETCRQEFQALVHNIRKGWGIFCSRACLYAGRKARPRTAIPTVTRILKAGESVPATKPRRYVNVHGYVILRWTIAPHQVVECLEHRLVAGVVDGKHVHHINGDKTDNRPENLEHKTPSEHQQHHHPIAWNVVEAAELYDDGWTLPRLADRYGVHYVTIARAFQVRGIQRRKGWRYCIQPSKVLAMHDAGVRYDEMARRLNVSRPVVERVCRELALPKFKPGRPYA